MKKVIILGGFLFTAVTPALANNADRFGEQDPIGWMMAIISMGVVFSALVVLFLSFKYLYPLLAWCGLQIMKMFHRKKQIEQVNDRRAQASKAREEAKKGAASQNEEELAALIAVGLFLHEDGMHDQESGVLTLAPSASPWTGAGNNQKKSPLRKF